MYMAPISDGQENTRGLVRGNGCILLNDTGR